MSKRRNHHKQASKAGKDVPVPSRLLEVRRILKGRPCIIVKRSLAELRKIAEEEEQARWEELQLAHQLSKWL